MPSIISLQMQQISAVDDIKGINTQSEFELAIENSGMEGSGWRFQYIISMTFNLFKYECDRMFQFCSTSCEK